MREFAYGPRESAYRLRESAYGPRESAYGLREFAYGARESAYARKTDPRKLLQLGSSFRQTVFAGVCQKPTSLENVLAPKCFQKSPIFAPMPLSKPMILPHRNLVRFGKYLLATSYLDSPLNKQDNPQQIL